MIDQLLVAPSIAIVLCGTGLRTVAAGSQPPDGLGILLITVGIASAVATVVWNVGLMGGRTGHTVGKRTAGLTLVDADTGWPVGSYRALLRHALHIVDTVPMLSGFLRPLWAESRQTFAYAITGTIVFAPRGQR